MTSSATIKTAKRIVRRDGSDGKDDGKTPDGGALECCARISDAGDEYGVLEAADGEEATERSARVPDGKDDAEILQELEDDNSDSWAGEYPRLDLNYEALRHIADHFLPGDHGRCITITELDRGSYHEIRVLHFEDGWTCAARFSRNTMDLLFTESEVATMEFVRKISTIPVPEVFYVSHNNNDVVGAAFMLMEHMSGKSMDGVYEDLSLDHKKAVLSQLADVKHQLASLQFEEIGLFTTSGIRPLIERHYGEHSRGTGPSKTMREYCHGMLDISPSLSCCEECMDHCKEIRQVVDNFFDEPKPVHRFCDGPFGLMHMDLNPQNMLFDCTDETQAPKLTAIIDWDGAATHPLYFILDHPHFLYDRYGCEDHLDLNKTLRQHFIHELKSKHPEGYQQRQDVYDCFRLKEYFPQAFCNTFPGTQREHSEQKQDLENLIPIMKAGFESHYEVLNWEMDTDSEYSEDESESESEDESEEESDEDDDDAGAESGSRSEQDDSEENSDAEGPDSDDDVFS